MSTWRDAFIIAFLFILYWAGCAIGYLNGWQAHKNFVNQELAEKFKKHVELRHEH